MFARISCIILGLLFSINISKADINITPAMGFLFYNFGGEFAKQKHYNGSLFVDFTLVNHNLELGFGVGFDKLVMNKAGYNISYEDAIASKNYFDDVNVRPVYAVLKYSINSFLFTTKIGGAIAQAMPYQIANQDSISYITPKTAMFAGLNLGYIFENNLIISLDFTTYQIKEDALIVAFDTYKWQLSDRYENKIGASVGYRFNIKR